MATVWIAPRWESGTQWIATGVYRSNSPERMPVVKAVQPVGGKTSAGPLRSLVSRTATAWSKASSIDS